LQEEGCAHPFWSSHKEKRPWLELFMGGGHGRTLSSMTGHRGALGRGKRGGGEGRGAGGAIAGRWKGGRGDTGRGCMEQGSALYCCSESLFV
jgi:hypothetical protein